MRVALYHRVSTLDQNPELARDELRAAARARGGDVVLDVEETGSGAKNDRPGLARVMGAARAGRLDAVLVWKLDRFGRSALDLLANVRSLRDGGVSFIATSQGLEISDRAGAIGNLLLMVLAGVAEFELETIRERTRLGLANARKAGKRLGVPPAEFSERALTHAGTMVSQGASWRTAWRALESLDWLTPYGAGKRKGRLPSVPALYRACTKRFPGLAPTTPRIPRGKRR